MDNQQNENSPLDSERMEQIHAKMRQRELVEFCKWVKDNHAWIKDIQPEGITATDGTLDYHFDPKGGLSIGYWPQLKSICGPEDDDATDLDRNAITGAILINKLGNQYLSSVISKAVKELEVYLENNGYLFWSVIEENHYEEVMAYLIARAEVIEKEMHEEKEEQARLARQKAEEQKNFQKQEEEACLARQQAKEEEKAEQVSLAYRNSLNTFLSSLNLPIPTSIPSDNVKVIEIVKIGFGHESFWLDFGKDDKVTLKKEENFIFRCFVAKVLKGSQSETVFHSDLHNAISESIPKSHAASWKLRSIISSLNGQFYEKGQPPDRDYWICLEKRHGYYLNKSIKWNADEKTIINRKSNSVWVQFNLASRTIDNWNKGKEGDDEQDMSDD